MPQLPLLTPRPQVYNPSLLSSPTFLWLGRLFICALSLRSGSLTFYWLCLSYCACSLVTPMWEFSTLARFHSEPTGSNHWRQKKNEFYLRSHGIPFLIAEFVPGHVVHLCEQEQGNDHYINANQNSVASFVEWSIVLTVDVCGDDASKLDTHFNWVSIYGLSGRRPKNIKMTYYCIKQLKHFVIQRYLSSLMPTRCIYNTN